uniref:Uncharacterized protein n=1 Tax=Myoviridae sp. ct8Uw4 TaxID=2825040 RepID=A0A8S5P218_9CAUD|nr:MAG TPA: hypothetical protein [Myoviridae sp. ct8Uw4]
MITIRTSRPDSALFLRLSFSDGLSRAALNRSLMAECARNTIPARGITPPLIVRF